jgi:hypothetical protein
MQIEIDGTVHSLTEWANIYNINVSTAWRRIKNGVNPKEAFTHNGLINTKLFEVNGEFHTLPEWAKIKNKKYCTLWKRVKRGMPIAEALGVKNG